MLGYIVLIWLLITFYTMVHASAENDNTPFVLLLFKGLGWPIYWGMYFWGKKFSGK